MNVTYTNKIKQNGEGYALIQQATNHLAEVVGESSAKVNAEWDRTEDENGRPLYTLRISDKPDTAIASFAAHELASPMQMQVLLPHLWGELLQARSHRLLKSLFEDEE